MSVKTNLEMKEILDQITNSSLSPNQYYLLHCIKDGTAPICINTHLELRALELGQWIIPQQDAAPLLTAKAEVILKEVDSHFGKSKKKISAKVVEPDFLDNCKKYNELIPNIKTPYGKYARASVANIEIAFKWFFSIHDYSWETILKATKAYVQECEKTSPSYKFLQTSQYFIRRQESDKSWRCELANWCTAVESGADFDNNNHFKDKVV